MLQQIRARLVIIRHPFLNQIVCNISEITPKQLHLLRCQKGNFVEILHLVITDIWLKPFRNVHQIYQMMAVIPRCRAKVQDQCDHRINVVRILMQELRTV